MWRLGSSVDLKRAHNPEVAGSNPARGLNHTGNVSRIIALRVLVVSPYSGRSATQLADGFSENVIVTQTRVRIPLAINYFVCSFHWGDLRRAQAMRSIDLFTSDRSKRTAGGPNDVEPPRRTVSPGLVVADFSRI